VAAPDDTIRDYLREVGYNAWSLYSNDLILQMVEKYQIEAVIYLTKVSAVIPHEEAITETRKLQIRVILTADKDKEEPLLNYAAAIGVTDILIYPVNPEEIIHRLKNPATVEEVFGFLKQIGQRTRHKQFQKTRDKDIDEIKDMDKPAWYKRFIDIGQGSKSVVNNSQTLSEKQIVKQSEKELATQLFTKTANPTTILGLGNKNLNEWFENTFSHTVEIVLAASSPEEFRAAVQEKQPDIAVIMRAGPTGGLPYADELAVFSCHYAQHVIFIAGELDDEGKVMAEIVKKAGGKVLSCPPGEIISGEELVLLIQNTINETIYENEQEEEIIYSNEKNEKVRGSTENFLLSISQVTDIFKRAVPRRAETEELPINAARIPKHPSAITAGGVLLIVSPWRPGVAGRIAARAAKLFSEGGSNVAVICASGRSTAASWLGVTDEELILSDWRVPGSQVPVDRGNIKIWAVDPAKSLHMNIKEDLPYILKEARDRADYTVIDFGEDIDLAQSYIHQKEAVLLCVVPGSDPVEQKTSLLWLKRTLGQKDNIVIGFDLREQGQIPEGVTSKLTITSTPEEALQNALKKNLDQYIWNEVIG